MRRYWASFHWATRISVLLVLFAIQWWQARYTWSIHNPMYGWPVSFNNVWSDGGRGEWHPWLLAFDSAVWLILLVSVGYAVERFWRRSKPFQFTLGSLFGLQAVLAILLALGYAEGHLRAHPNNGSIYPKYACRDLGGETVGLDIGLFTDPPIRWPLARMAIIFGIGCAMYTAGSLTLRAVRRRAAVANSLPSNKVPALARVVQWTLVVIDVFFLIGTLFPPVFH